MMVGFGRGPAVEFGLVAGFVGRARRESCARGFVFLFILFFIVEEIFLLPDVRAERSLIDGFHVENYVVHAGLESDTRKIAAGGLQGVEEESGGFAVDLPGDDEAHDLHE
jgi:hypothetical protein